MSTTSPPKAWLRFLRWFCHSDFVEEIEGDLLERFYDYAPTMTPRQARWRCRRDIITLLRPNLIRPIHLQITPIMLRQHLKISWRQLRREKVYTSLNIFGLALGIAIAILTTLWVRDEFAFDKNFTQYDRIGRVMQHRTFDGNKATWWSTAYPLAEALRKDYDHLFDRIALSTWPSTYTLTVGANSLATEGLFMDKGGPIILELHLETGSLKDFSGPGDILLSTQLAQQLFPNQDPLGQSLTIGEEVVQVRGVYTNLPENCSFHNVKYVASWELYPKLDNWIGEMPHPWYSSSFQALVLRKEQLNFEQISTQIAAIITDNASDESTQTAKPKAFVHPMNKWYLSSTFNDGYNTGGRIDAIWRFGFISALVLLLACINFINLSTARAERHALEVGVRKTLGSGRGLLLQQFYTSALLLVGLSFLLAVALAAVLTSPFNQLLDTSLNLFTAGWSYWLLALLLVVSLGIFLGSFSAWRLAGLKLLPALRANLHQATTSKALSRQALVVIQFTIAITLITGVLLVNQQIQMGQERDKGYDADDMLMTYVQDEQLLQSMTSVREELLQSGYFTELAQASAPVSEVWATNLGIRWPGKDPSVNFAFPNANISSNFGKTVGWTILQGRDFSPGLASDSSAFIINKAAMQYMGLSKPLGTIIHWNDEPFTIIGIVDNIITGSPYEPMQPQLYHVGAGEGRVIHLRLAQRDIPTALAKLETTYQRFFPGYVLDYSFADESFALKFGDEAQLQQLMTALSMLAIFISCLGLLGLATYMVQKRQREIGIRKVLGASVTQVWQLLSNQFMILVGLACVVAIPVAYLLARQWLAQYTLQTSIHWSLFVMAGLGAVVLALGTISWQTIRAARANPVKTIRLTG